MSHAVIDKLCEAWPCDRWRDVTVVVAVSGGADSVALLRATSELRNIFPGQGKLIAAHFNHGFRGDESQGDQAFVLTLCRQLNCPCETNLPHPAERRSVESMASVDMDGKASVWAAPERFSTPLSGRSEDAARRARYEFLRHAVARCGARYLATAHTADDQAETVLHRILRGTGLEGLAGIPGHREFLAGVTLVRPLLHVHRAELLDYLGQLRQDYRRDSSNLSLDYTRNRLRAELLPQLEREYNPGVREALCRLARLAGEANALVRQLANEHGGRAVVEQSPERIVLDECSLEGMPPYLIRSLLLALWRQQGWPLGAMSQDRWQQLEEFIRRPTGASARLHLPGHVSVERREEQIIIRRPAAR